MTGAIISLFYGKNQHGTNSRYFINGSFFFIEPDLAVTAFSNLAISRSSMGNVYGEDYFYFDSSIHHFETSVTAARGKQCIRLEREWLQEFPDKNITLIRFPFPVSDACFIYNKNSTPISSPLMAEGFGNADYLTVREDPSTINFIWLDEGQSGKLKLFRQYAEVDSVEEETVYTDQLQIDELEVINTNMYFHGSMTGGPLLDYKGKEVIGVLSHEPDDPFKPSIFKGVRLFGL